MTGVISCKNPRCTRMIQPNERISRGRGKVSGCVYCIDELENPMTASKMKCPVCGSKLKAGSHRFAKITPSNPDKSEQPYVEKFWITIFYCQKSDEHTFGILERVKEEYGYE